MEDDTVVVVVGMLRHDHEPALLMLLVLTLPPRFVPLEKNVPTLT